MPSVGGGSGGGGFHGGGSSHGGGGSFHHRGGGYFFYGGGIISTIFSIIFMPLIFMASGIFMTALGIKGFVDPLSTDISYDETTFQQFAFEKYEEYYGKDENEILFVLLTSPDQKDGYYQISIVGNNIKSGISAMFGGDSTTFGRAFDNAMPDAYTHSALNAFRSALSRTAEDIEDMRLESNFYYKVEDKGYRPKFVNKTDYMDIDETYILPAMNEFTEKTGIVFGIYVEDMDKVFGREGKNSFSLVIFGLVFFSAGAYVGFLGVKGFKKYREEKANKDKRDDVKKDREERKDRRDFDSFARDREDNSSKKNKDDPFDF